MKKIPIALLTLAVLFLLSSCTVQSKFVRWDAPLIRNTTSAGPSTYWENGNQYFLAATDRLDLSFTGFVNAKYLVIVVAMKNRSGEIIHFYPSLCSISQPHRKKNQMILPLRPARLDEKTRGFIMATAALNVLNVAFVGDRQTSDQIHNAQVIETINNEDEKAALAKNHSLFPNDYYSGCLFFERSTTGMNSDAVNIQESFDLHFVCSGERLSVTGRVPSDAKYDGTELPHLLERIIFNKNDMGSDSTESESKAKSKLNDKEW